MSKEAAQRAMREAKYAARSAGAASPATARRRPPVAPPLGKPSPATATSAEVAPAAEATDELCGHKSMNGRTCTREKGHAAKNHRYS